MKLPLVALVFVFSSIPALAQSAPTVQQAEAACGPDKVKFSVSTHDTGHPLASVAADKAQVYVIGDVPGHGGILSLDPTIRVGMDGHWIGADEDLSYMFFSVDPGDHHLCIRTQTTHTDLQRLVSLAKFTAQAAQTYYFRVQVRRQGGPEKVGAELDIEPLNVDEAHLLLAQYPYARSAAKK